MRYRNFSNFTRGKKELFFITRENNQSNKMLIFEQLRFPLIVRAILINLHKIGNFVFQ